MAKDAFVTEAKARRIINAIHATGLSIDSVIVNADGVKFELGQQTERSAGDIKRLNLPESWDVCPFDAVTVDAVTD